MAATTSDGSPQRQLTESLKRFSRSIELCDDYLRGYYGLKLVGSISQSALGHTHANVCSRSRRSSSKTH